METASFPYLKPINNYYTFAKLLFGRSGRSLCFGSRSRRAYRFTSRGAGRAKVTTAGEHTLSLEITGRHIAVSPHVNRTTVVTAFESLFQILYILVFGQNRFQGRVSAVPGSFYLLPPRLLHIASFLANRIHLFVESLVGLFQFGHLLVAQIQIFHHLLARKFTTQVSSFFISCKGTRRQC